MLLTSAANMLFILMIYMAMQNDVSFMIGLRLSLYEHQSTYNPNMPLRNFFYISSEYQKLVDHKSLYSSVLQKIPAPQFIVFYNGLEKWIEDEDEIRLSYMYEILTDNPELELKVRVININKDVHILNKCKTLRDYMTFVNKVRFKMGVEGDDVRIAVTEAMDECIDEDILVDFFEKHREEVVEVSIYDYDEEEVRRVLAEEYAQEYAQKVAKEVSEKAFAEGEQSGRQLNLINQVIKKVKKSKTLETIASELEEEEADIKPIYDAVVSSAPDYDINVIKDRLDNM